MPRSIGLLCVAWLVSLGAASSAHAAACAYDPVCPYQGIEVLGGGDAASLDGPLAVAMTPSGDVLVLDQAKDSVREFTATGQLVQQIGTPGSYIDGVAVNQSSGEIWVSDDIGDHGFAADGTPNATTGGQPPGPFQFGGIAVSPSGNVYVFNAQTSSIVEYSPSGAFVTTWPAPNVEPGDLEMPVALAVDGQGNVYVGAVDDESVSEFNSAGTKVATLSVPSLQGLAIYGSTLYAQLGTSEIATYDLSLNPESEFGDSELADAEDGPTFAVGASGVDAVTADHMIEQFSLDGTPTGSWGGLAIDDFQASYALADSAGNIYVLDNANGRIIRYDAQGDPPTVFADLTAYGGTAGFASFDSVGDLVVDGGWDVVTLGPDGSVISAVGKTPGPGYPGQLGDAGSEISYTATDSAGNIYIDAFHGTDEVPVGDIGKYSPTGQLLQVFDASATWGLGIPGPLAVDAQGRIYTATNADDIREFDPDGTMIAVWPTSAPAGSISVPPNGDVYATTGATVTRFSDFLDPLPTVPPASDSPFVQSMYASIAVILARQSLTGQSSTAQSSTGQSATALSTTIACTGSASLSCVGTLSLSAKVRTRNLRTKRMTTRPTLLGKKAFSIPAGQRRSETVRLNGTARRLLATRSTLDATLTATYRAGTKSRTVTRKVVLHGHRRKGKALKPRAGTA